jgi:hypothetical protein
MDDEVEEEEESLKLGEDGLDLEMPPEGLDDDGLYDPDDNFH